MSEPMNVDDAMEAITVAISLGMTVPVLEGMTVWEAKFVDTGYSGDARYEISARNCSSKEAALSHIRNEALVLILKAYNFDEGVRRRVTKNSTMEEYFLNAPVEEIIRDYEYIFEVNFTIELVPVTSKVEEPLTFEQIRSRAFKNSDTGGT